MKRELPTNNERVLRIKWHGGPGVSLLYQTNKERNISQVVVTHSLNPITWVTESGGYTSSRPVWLTYWVQVRGYTEKDCLGKQKEANKQMKKQNINKNLGKHFHIKLPSIFRVRFRNTSLDDRHVSSSSLLLINK